MVEFLITGTASYAKIYMSKLYALLLSVSTDRQGFMTREQTTQNYKKKKLITGNAFPTFNSC